MRDEMTYQALCWALDDEYQALAAYQAVLAAFGPVQPHTNIAAAEARHVNALLAQFQRLGWDAPADRWRGRVAAPTTLAEAWRAAIAAERSNAALYDTLATMTTDPLVLRVFARLRAASIDCHLPAFERAAEGGEHACCATRGGHARAPDGRCGQGWRRHPAASPAP